MHPHPITYAVQKICAKKRQKALTPSDAFSHQLLSLSILSQTALAQVQPASYFFAMYLRISRAIETMITIPCTIY